MHWETPKKILGHSSPPERKQNILQKKPKIGPYIDRIQEILEQDKFVHKKQRHSAKRIWNSHQMDRNGRVRQVTRCLFHLGLEDVDCPMSACWLAARIGYVQFPGIASGGIFRQ